MSAIVGCGDKPSGAPAVSGSPSAAASSTTDSTTPADHQPGGGSENTGAAASEDSAASGSEPVAETNPGDVAEPKKTPPPIIIERSPDADRARERRAERDAEAIERNENKKPFEPVQRDDGLIAFNEQQTVLMDKEHKRVLLKTRVVQQDVQLEMFCCLKQTKEHESIVSLDGEARAVHAALLAIGAEPGKAVQYDEQTGVTPPTGQEIQIDVVWKDADGEEQRKPAQSWIRRVTRRYFVVKMDKLPQGLVIPDDSLLNYDTKHRELTWYGPMTPAKQQELKALSPDAEFHKAVDYFYDQGLSREMEAKFVFVGSGFYHDPRTGIDHYMAEGGYLITVANFPQALIDVAADSSESDKSLLFESYTERIPPKETEVTLELIPVVPEEKKAE